MRNFPGFVLSLARPAILGDSRSDQRRGLTSSSTARVLVSALAVTCAVGSVSLQTALASGPVERLVEVLLNPADPQAVVVRWGVASEGFLFSSDGGHSYKAMCSQAITPSAEESDKIRHLTGKSVPGAAATLIDTHGKLVVGQIGGLWTDDGTGCGWTKQLDGQWPYSVLRDPAVADELIALVSTTSTSDTQTSLMRRAADGVTWTQAGLVLPALPGQRAYAGDLIASRTAAGTQLYASVAVSQGTSSKQTSMIVGSSDGGKTWSAGFPQPATQEDLTLLAIDPNEPRRILATIYRNNAPDSLLLSDDQGATFSPYQEIRETSGVTFGPDGRVYVADAGDSTGSDAIGGLYTAAKLGDPLTLVGGTSLLDCATYDPSSQKLFACRRDKVGLLDPVSGQFESYAQIAGIPSQISCPDVDITEACSSQLNAGASWCCAGHYPFTPFCGDYDVTMRDGVLLLCGLSGRISDAMSGRGPADAGTAFGLLDAGTPSFADGGGSGARDAGAPTAAPAKSSGDGGCSAARPGGAGSLAGLLATLSIALVALARARSRRRR